MTGYILAFGNTQDAVSAERKLLDAGVDAQVMPAPKSMDPGCGICIMVDSADTGKAKLLLGKIIRHICPENGDDSAP